MSSDVSGRVLRVFVEGWIIEDGSLPRPEVGRTLEASLEFRRRDRNRDDPGLMTLRGRVQPLPRMPYRDRGKSMWNSLLRGDGWSAFWSSDRPWTGQVEITGALEVDYQCAADAVRGQVTRVQVVSVPYTFAGEQPNGWSPTAGAPWRYDDVSKAPGRFERAGDGYRRTGTVPDPATAEESQIGVLVDLDLARAEPAPLRPRIIPGSVGAYGSELWVLDRDLPILVHIADPAGQPVVTEHLLPAPVATERVLPGFRRLFVDDGGCWVVGVGSILRVTGQFDGAVRARPVDVGAVWGSAAVDGVLLTVGEQGAQLHLPDREPVRVQLPEGRLDRPVAVADGFLLTVQTPDPQCEPRGGDGGYGNRHVAVRIGLDGVVTASETPIDLGVVLREVAVPAGAQIETVDGSVMIDTDLRARLGVSLPRSMLSGGMAGDRWWITTHRPDGTGRSGWWPLHGREDLPPRAAGKWLFVLLDVASSQIEAVIPIDDPQPDVAATDDGTVWIAGAGLRGIRPDGTVVELDVSELLD